MLNFVIARTIRATITILVLVVAAFLILRASGDAALATLSVEADSTAIEAFRAKWGLQRDLGVQLVEYMQGLLGGHLGYSMRYGLPALEVITQRLPLTLMIAVPGLLLKILFGVAIGLAAAATANSRFDRIVTAFCTFGYATPNFVLSIVMIFVFSLALGWLPSSGSATPAHIVLPIAVLVLSGVGVVVRYTRSIAIQVLQQRFIRASRLKGVGTARLMVDHVLPNLAVPLVTITGMMAGNIVAGTVVVESVFAWPGIGQLLVTSVVARDFAVVQGILLFAGGIMVVSTLFADVMCAVLDPNFRSAQENG